MFYSYCIKICSLYSSFSYLWLRNYLPIFFRGFEEPNYDQCVSNSINNIKKKICTGMPELNIPPNELIIIDKLIIYDCQYQTVSDRFKNIWILWFYPKFLSQISINLISMLSISNISVWIQRTILSYVYWRRLLTRK